MTNYEKYKDKMIDELFTSKCYGPCVVHRIRTDSCLCGMKCETCMKENAEWLSAEYTEKIDWSKVEQGTIVYAPHNIIGQFVSKYNKVIVLYIEGRYCGYHEGVCRLEK